MKKIATLLYLLSITASAFSQFNIDIHSKEFSNIDNVKAIEAYNTKIQLGAISTIALDSFTDETVNGPVSLHGHKALYFYDTQGRDTITLSYYRRYPQDPWVLMGKNENLYNSLNQLVTRVTYDIDSNNVSTISYKSSYHYNSSFYIVEVIDSLFDINTNSYYIRSKSIYTRDSLGNILTATHYSISSIGSPLAPNNLELLIYDNTSRITEHTFFQWDGNLNKWKYLNKEETVFNSYHKIDSNINLIWNDTLSIWDTVNIECFAYNSFGDLITSDFFNFKNHIKNRSSHDTCFYNAGHEMVERLNYSSIGSGQLDTNAKAIYTRDNKGNIISELYYRWKVFNTSGWDTSWRSNYSFNTNYLVKDAIFPFSFQNSSESDYIFLGSYQEIYNTFDYTWTTWYIHNYYYSSKIIDGIDEGKQNAILVYPNPSDDIVHFNLPDNTKQASIEIFDISGKLMLKKMISSDYNLSVKSFSSGVYLYHLSFENNTITGKILVK